MEGLTHSCSHNTSTVSAAPRCTVRLSGQFDTEHGATRFDTPYAGVLSFVSSEESICSYCTKGLCCVEESFDTSMPLSGRMFCIRLSFIGHNAWQRMAYNFVGSGKTWRKHDVLRHANPHFELTHKYIRSISVGRFASITLVCIYIFFTVKAAPLHAIQYGNQTLRTMCTVCFLVLLDLLL